MPTSYGSDSLGVPPHSTRRSISPTAHQPTAHQHPSQQHRSQPQQQARQQPQHAAPSGDLVVAAFARYLDEFKSSVAEERQRLGDTSLAAQHAEQAFAQDVEELEGRVSQQLQQLTGETKELKSQLAGLFSGLSEAVRDATDEHTGLELRLRTLVEQQTANFELQSRLTQAADESREKLGAAVQEMREVFDWSHSEAEDVSGFVAALREKSHAKYEVTNRAISQLGLQAAEHQAAGQSSANECLASAAEIQQRLAELVQTMQKQSSDQKEGLNRVHGQLGGTNFGVGGLVM